MRWSRRAGRSTTTTQPRSPRRCTNACATASRTATPSGTRGRRSIPRTVRDRAPGAPTSATAKQDGGWHNGPEGGKTAATCCSKPMRNGRCPTSLPKRERSPARRIAGPRGRGWPRASTSIWGQVLEHDWKSCPLWAARGRRASGARRSGRCDRVVPRSRRMVEWRLCSLGRRATRELRGPVGAKALSHRGHGDHRGRRVSRRGRQEAFSLVPTRADQRAARPSRELSTRSGRRRSTTKPGIDALRARIRLLSQGRGRRSPDPYSSLNRMQLGKLLAETAPEGAPTIEDVERRIGSTEQPRPSAEATTGPESVRSTPCSLASSKQGELATRSRRLHDEYCSVFSERSKWSERDSTISHLWDLSQLHPDLQEAARSMSLNQRLSDTGRARPEPARARRARGSRRLLDLLHGPAVAVRVLEEDEPAPGEVLDLADLDAALREVGARRFGAGDDDL